MTTDTAYLASVVNQIDGPVLLVGHSYGGAVISNAATDAPNVVGLVYVAAFAPDKDERLGDVTATSKDSVLGTALVQRQYPAGADGETAPEFSIDPARFHEVFAADLPAEPGRGDGRHPAAHRGRGVQRPVRTAGLEEAAVVGGGRHRRQGRRQPTSSVRWPSARAPTSPRSRART